MYHYCTAYTHVPQLYSLHTCTTTVQPTYMYHYCTAYIHVPLLYSLHTCTTTVQPTYKYLYCTAYIHVPLLYSLHTCTTTVQPTYTYHYCIAYLHVNLPLLYRLRTSLMVLHHVFWLQILTFKFRTVSEVTYMYYLAFCGQ